jgi:hypothetical protein
MLSLSSPLIWGNNSYENVTMNKEKLAVLPDLVLVNVHKIFQPQYYLASSSDEAKADFMT